MAGVSTDLTALTRVSTGLTAETATVAGELMCITHETHQSLTMFQYWNIRRETVAALPPSGPEPGPPSHGGRHAAWIRAAAAVPRAVSNRRLTHVADRRGNIEH
ncbi:MAG: hypothetical protein QOE51_3570 [Actinoplanes sp.]|nr:hypothetical protein [Actinoplanes sp.]